MLASILNPKNRKNRSKIVSKSGPKSDPKKDRSWGRFFVDFGAILGTPFRIPEQTALSAERLCFCVRKITMLALRSPPDTSVSNDAITTNL